METSDRACHLIVTPGAATATAACTSGAGSCASMLHALAAASLPPMASSRAGRSGSSETSKLSSGYDRPSPIALMNASLRVHPLKNARQRSAAGSASNSRCSAAEKHVRTSCPMSSVARTRSTSTPIDAPRVTTTTQNPSVCDRLNCSPGGASTRYGLPRSPWRNRSRAGFSWHTMPSTRLRMPCDITNVRRSRSKANRAARTRSAGERSAYMRRTVCGPAYSGTTHACATPSSSTAGPAAPITLPPVLPAAPTDRRPPRRSPDRVRSA